jgi:hypothetical protein
VAKADARVVVEAIIGIATISVVTATNPRRHTRHSHHGQADTVALPGTTLPKIEHARCGETKAKKVAQIRSHYNPNISYCAML